MAQGTPGAFPPLFPRPPTLPLLCTTAGVSVSRRPQEECEIQVRTKSADSERLPTEDRFITEQASYLKEMQVAGSPLGGGVSLPFLYPGK